MTSIASAHPLPPDARLWIEGDVESLFDVLLEHGFEERSSMISDGLSVPDGLYVERADQGLLVWVPPDPKRTGLDPMVLPPAVRIDAEPRAGGTQISLHHTEAPATTVSFAIASILSWVAVGVGWMLASTVVWSVLGVAAVLFWGALLYQQRVASARTRLAWNALQPVLGEVAASEPMLPPEGDPYR